MSYLRVRVEFIYRFFVAPVLVFPTTAEFARTYVSLHVGILCYRLMFLGNGSEQAI